MAAKSNCMNRTLYQPLLYLFMAVIGTPQVAQSQSVQPAIDGTGTVVTSPANNPNQFNINGGTVSGGNLFHSFQQFGLGQDQTANFLTTSQIQNILARIAGGNPSVINGLIQVTGGNANLYLMNPSGIIFGANASLNVPASFTATTANGIGFGSNWFNASGFNNYATLTGIPDRLAFTPLQPGSIVNLGNLAVPSGQTLTLLGGTALSTGQLVAPFGQVTVAAVPGQNVVRVSQVGSMLMFDLQPIGLGSSQPNTWTLPIASLPQLLTGGGIGNATSVRVNPDGTVQLTGSGIPIQSSKATVAANNIVQISNVFENTSGILDIPGTTDEFGSFIIQFDNAPLSQIADHLETLSTTLSVRLPDDEQSQGDCVVPGSDAISIQSEQSRWRINPIVPKSDNVSPAIENLLTNPDALLRQGNQQYETRQFPAALVTYQQSLAGYQAQKNLTCTAELLYRIGNAERGLGQYANAIAHYQQALAVQPPSNKASQTARILNNLGATNLLLGQFAPALETQQQALVLRQQAHDRRGEANTLSNIGAIQHNLGNYPQALQAYQQALGLFHALNDRAATADTLSNLGLTYDSLGQYPQALAQYRQVLAQREQMGDLNGKGTALHNIGLAYRHLKQYSEALSYYQQALSIRQQLNDRVGMGETLDNIGDSHERLGQYPLALTALQQALTIAQSLGRRDNEANILDTTANVYRGLGQPTQARALYQEALAIQQNIGSRASERRTLSHLGDLFKPTEPELAIVFYKQSVNVTEAIRQELRLLPREQQEAYTQTVAITYRSLADLLLSQGRVLEAQQVLELLKIEEIRIFTRDAKTSQQPGEIALNAAETGILKQHGSLIAFGQKIYQCKQTQCAQLSQLNDELQSLTEQYNQTVASFAQVIRQRRADDEGFLDPSKLVVKAKAIVEAEPGTVLIYPLVLKDKIWLVLAAPGGVVKTVQVPVSEPELGATVLKFRQLLQSPLSSSKDVKATGKVLYDWLIKPLATELNANQIRHLVFSLDRVTRYIPVSALFDGKQYLVENYRISTVLSADLTDMRDRRALDRQTTPVLALGVSNAVADFSALPNVPEELAVIVKQPPQDARGIYPGQKFLNQSFDFRTLRDHILGHKIIHIATHAKFVPGRPEDSFLLLGSGDKLTIPAIQTLQDLSEVQLVVLSACSTALGGPDQDGIEISGISSYFLNAGAKSVMASLWTVDDTSTSQLMQAFYNQLATGAPIDRTKAAALRQAQLSLLLGDRSGQAEFAHPYFWAPFVLIGNGL